MMTDRLAKISKRFSQLIVLPVAERECADHMLLLVDDSNSRDIFLNDQFQSIFNRRMFVNRMNFPACLSHAVRCTLYAVHCTLYTVRCTLYAVHCVLPVAEVKLFDGAIGMRIKLIDVFADEFHNKRLADDPLEVFAIEHGEPAQTTRVHSIEHHREIDFRTNDEIFVL